MQKDTSTDQGNGQTQVQEPNCDATANLSKTNQHSLSHKEKQTKNRAATAAHPSSPSHQVKNQLVCLSCTLFHTSGQKWLYYSYVKLQQLPCQHLSLDLRKKQEGELQGKGNLWSHLIFIHLTGRENT